MSDFKLPERSTEASPIFTDGAACAAWLDELPLVNIAPSQIRLLEQLRELNRFGMPPEERLKVLETLREPIHFVQVEQVKKVGGKALPLTQIERGIFMNVAQLWQELLTGYEHCIAGAAEGKLEGKTALLCARALDCVAANMFDHCRVYHAFPDACWRTLHELYARAEAARETATAVPDPVTKTEVSCSEVYVRALLFELADPNGQQQKQQKQIRGWLARWAQHVPVRTAAPADQSLPPLLLDFSSASGAYREADAAGRSASHWLDVGELARILKKCVVLLRKGEPPAKLGLGEDCAMPGVEQQLVQLFRLWCEGKNARAQTRRSVSEKAQVCSTLASMHFHISGYKVFRQPGHTLLGLTRREHDEIATFGRTSTRVEEAFVQAGGYAVEAWQLREESLSGLRLVRPAGSGGARYLHTQLIAVRPSDAKNFMVGVVRWLSTDENDNLQVGVGIVPGIPQAVAVRSTGINAKAERFVQALYCPPLPALGVPESLILAPGSYRPKRVLELYREASESVLLARVIERGFDFERVAMEPAP